MKDRNIFKGPFKYYVIKRGGQVGGWGRPNDYGIR